MPLQNRVLPTGEIVSSPARGTFTGNRGIIHAKDRTLGTSRWSHHAWICCTLDWQGRKRQVMSGRNWTELFFLDEAVAIAAGHRPCGYCRRNDYNRFVDAWATAFEGRVKAPVIDRTLHKARIIKGSRTQKHHVAARSDLPDGTMVVHANKPHLLSGDGAFPFTPDRYETPTMIATDDDVTVLTPAPMVAILRAGYRPAVHSSAALSGPTAN